LDPTGFIVNDKGLNMAVQIMQDRERPKFAAALPTPNSYGNALNNWTGGEVPAR
jgi:hypothetical protein